MSSTFSKNKKELAGLKLLPSEKVWVKGKNGKLRLNRKYKFLGKIDRSMPNFIIKANNPENKNYFIDDTSALPAATKSKVVNYFLNEKSAKGKARRVVYLVRGDKKQNKK